MRQRLKKGVLLEREGVIIQRLANDCAAPSEEIEFLPRALDALRLLAKNEIPVIIVSDRSCVNNSAGTNHQQELLTRRLLLEIAIAGGNIEKVYYCPHLPSTDCLCRKPFPGLLLRAMVERSLSPAETYMIGAEERDIQAAARAGCRGILLRRNSFLTQETRREDSLEIASSLWEAAERIVRRMVPRLSEVLQNAGGFPVPGRPPLYFDVLRREKDLA